MTEKNYNKRISSDELRRDLVRKRRRKKNEILIDPEKKHTIKSKRAPMFPIFMVKPSPKIQIYHGDCIQEMKRIPTGSVDMVCADPPYGITSCKWDSVINLDEMWIQLKRITKPCGAIVLFSAQPFTSRLVSSNYKMFKQELVWKKNVSTNFLNAKKMHLKKHENICVFYRKQTVFNPQFSHSTPYFTNRNGRAGRDSCYGTYRHTSTSRPDGKRNPVSILEYDVINNTKRVHPTQKPVNLIKYLIKTYSNPGDTVLDFVMGSGSTGIAAIQTGRAFIGIELDDKYFAVAKKRIRNASVTNEKIHDLL